jgi:hypothetical protein
MLRAFVAVAFAASFTRTVNDEVAAVVGVPEIAPAVDSVKPEGSVPDASVHVYGVVPPLACSDDEYAVLTVPPESAVVETVRGELAVVYVKELNGVLAELEGFVTTTVTAPAARAGVVAFSCVALTKVTALPAVPPN